MTNKSGDITKKFKDRYVLAEGYPWIYDKISLRMCAMQGGPANNLRSVTNLDDWKCPKYRLVLERIQPQKEKRCKKQST